MFKRTKYYIIAAVVLALGIILLYNKFLALGLIIFGIAALIVVFWELLLKEKARQIERLNDKLLDIDEENKRLKNDLEDYSKRKLNISEITPILDLGLFEVKTNFKRTVNRKLKVNERSVQFIGVIDVDFTAKYGVNFKKLMFKIDEENKEIFISNADPEFLSFTNRSSKWEIAEILQYNIPFLGAGHWRTNPRLENLANNIKEEIRIQVEKESENGPSELKWIVEPLRKHVEHALELFLGAQGYRVRITEQVGDDFKSIDEYKKENELDQMNRRTGQLNE